uniref:Uncharacterized protein n=1 Tax=Corethron hystrix TaxID=216773 RepID=A0A7S1FY72_9STRA
MLPYWQCRSLQHNSSRPGPVSLRSVPVDIMGGLRLRSMWRERATAMPVPGGSGSGLVQGLEVGPREAGDPTGGGGRNGGEDGAGRPKKRTGMGPEGEAVFGH